MGQRSSDLSLKPGCSESLLKCCLVPLCILLPGKHFTFLLPIRSTRGPQPGIAVDDPEKSIEDKPEFALESDPWHQLRQVLAGVLALVAGLYDAWIMGSARGFDISFDTVLVLTGLYLISGASSLMSLTKSRPSSGVPQK